MTRVSVFCVVAAAASLAMGGSAALALDPWPDVVQVGVMSGGGFAFGDFMWSPVWGPGLGVDLGIYGYNDGTDSPHETYAAVTYRFATGPRLAMGVPVPAYDRFAVSPLDRMLPVHAVDHPRASRSEATSAAMSGRYVPYGFSVSTQAGDLRYALSVHRDSDTNVVLGSIGASMPLGNGVMLSGAVEGSDGGARDLAAKVQVTRQKGQRVVGLGLSFPGYPGVSDYAEGFASAPLSDHLAVTGLLRVPLDASAPLLALAGRVKVSPGRDFVAGVLSEGGHTHASAFLEMTF